MLKQQKLIILKGLPASGKSFYAKEQAKLNKNTVIVNRDKIREMLKGVYEEFPFGGKMENLVTRLERYSAEQALCDGYDVIIDATNFRGNEIWKLLAENCMAPFEVVLETIDFTDVPLEVCLERDSKRSPRIGEQVIRNMYEKYLKNVEK